VKRASRGGLSCFPYGSSEQDAREKLHTSLLPQEQLLLFDLSILVQTVEVVLLGNGAR